MDVLVLGLLCIIGLLSLLICALLRIIVELIDGSGEHHKSYSSILTAALCGNYKNESARLDIESGKPNRQNMTHYEQYEQQLLQQLRHQYKLPSRDIYSDKQLADNLRITFSDVRMTEYNFNNNDSEHKFPHEDAKISFSDIRLSENPAFERPSTRNTFSKLPTQPEEDADEEDMQPRKTTAEENSRGSALFFKIPSFIRPSVVRRKSSLGISNDDTTAMNTLKNTSSDKEIVTGEPRRDSESDSESFLDAHPLSESDEVFSNPQSTNNNHYSPSPSSAANRTPFAPGSATDKGQTGGRAWKEDNVVESETFELDAPSAQDTKAMGPSIHQVEPSSPRNSMDLDDTFSYDAQQHELEILRLQREIEALEELEKQDEVRGDAASFQQHEHEIQKIQQEIDELERDMRSRNEDLPVGNSASSLLGANSRDIVTSGKQEAPSSSTSTKKVSFLPFSKGSRAAKLNTEEAYTEGISNFHSQVDTRHDDVHDESADHNQFDDSNEDDWPSSSHIVHKPSSQQRDHSPSRGKTVTFHKSSSLPTEQSVRSNEDAPRPLSIQKSSSQSQIGSTKKIRASVNSRAASRKSSSPPRRLQSGEYKVSVPAREDSIAAKSTLKLGRATKVKIPESKFGKSQHQEGLTFNEK